MMRKMNKISIIGGTDADPLLICPVCGFEHVHPISVKVATGDYLTTIDSKGTMFNQE